MKMKRIKKRAVVSISFLDFDFGDDFIVANSFASIARATSTDQSREVELNVKYLSDEDIEENIEEDKEEEQHDRTTD